jgi:hypothetical protein
VEQGASASERPWFKSGPWLGSPTLKIRRFGGPYTVFNWTRSQWVSDVSPSRSYSGFALAATYRHISERPVFEDEADEVVYTTDPEPTGEEQTESVPTTSDSQSLQTLIINRWRVIGGGRRERRVPERIERYVGTYPGASGHILAAVVESDPPSHLRCSMRLVFSRSRGFTPSDPSQAVVHASLFCLVTRCTRDDVWFNTVYTQPPSRGITADHAHRASDPCVCDRIQAGESRLNGRPAVSLHGGSRLSLCATEHHRQQFSFGYSDMS